MPKRSKYLKQKYKAKKARQVIFKKNWTKLKKFKKLPYPLNPKLLKIYTEKKKFKKALIINIRLTPNNVFCTLRNNFKTFYICSGGKYNLRVSKKNLRFNNKLILLRFLKKIKKKIKKRFLFIHLSSPIKIRKRIIKQLTYFCRHNKKIIQFKHKKCFNGCRAIKSRRKKRKGFRILK